MSRTESNFKMATDVLLITLYNYINLTSHLWTTDCQSRGKGQAGRVVAASGGSPMLTELASSITDEWDVILFLFADTCILQVALSVAWWFETMVLLLTLVDRSGTEPLSSRAAAWRPRTRILEKSPKQQRINSDEKEQ
jgi:hypothetical protein